MIPPQPIPQMDMMNRMTAPTYIQVVDFIPTSMKVYSIYVPGQK
jgi:hypothetical protein